jgi:hypothetical protein
MSSTCFLPCSMSSAVGSAPMTAGGAASQLQRKVSATVVAVVRKGDLMGEGGLGYWLAGRGMEWWRGGVMRMRLGLLVGGGYISVVQNKQR